MRLLEITAGLLALATAALAALTSAATYSQAQSWIDMGLGLGLMLASTACLGVGWGCMHRDNGS